MPGKRVLIIDDSKTMLAMMSSVLRNGGYDVSICENGAQGLTFAQQNRPDLILLDLILPDGSGLDILSQLKQGEATKSIPVAILTGRDGPEEVSKGASLGAIGFLTKYNTMPKMVLEKVKSWLPVA